VSEGVAGVCVVFLGIELGRSGVAPTEEVLAACDELHRARTESDPMQTSVRAAAAKLVLALKALDKPLAEARDAVATTSKPAAVTVPARRVPSAVAHACCRSRPSTPRARTGEGRLASCLPRDP
jgi:hypothetical protein